MTAQLLPARCGAQSRLAVEDMRGSVPAVTGYVLHPAAAPWPRVIPDGDPLPGTPPVEGARTLYYRPYPGQPTTETPLRWDTRRRVLERHDGTAWVAGPPEARFFGVCIHGRHDTCCGIRGGAITRRMVGIAPDSPVYGVSHLGGDRFAASCVVLPTGYLLGRLDDLSDERLRELLVDGLLPLGHIRGRLGVSAAESVAEIWFRETFRLRDAATVPAVTVAEQAAVPGCFEARVEHHGHGWLLALRRESREATEIRATCAAASPGPVFGWNVTALEEYQVPRTGRDHLPRQEPPSRRSPA